MLYHIYEDFDTTDGLIVDEEGLLNCAKQSLENLINKGNLGLETPKGTDLDSIKIAIKIIETDGLNVEKLGNTFQVERL